MKKLWVLGVLVALVLAAAPAQAFNADTLDISVQENGDAVITFTYQLNWFEYVVVFLRIADPAAQLQRVLASSLGRTVVVNSVSPGMSSLDVEGFAAVEQGQSGMTYTTPSLDLGQARQYLKGQWFAGMVNPDFSPSLTNIRFPDGYVQQYQDQEFIPSVTHIIPL